jgi:hypothetical protein
MTEIYLAQFVDAATGETYEREYNETELAELAELQASVAEQEAKQEAKAAARASALAKLAELGLTEEEVAAL